jgi:predicted nucleic acid-binding protein
VKYLVDANVLSEPTKPAPNRTVVDWLSDQLKRAGRTLPLLDSMVAATALEHGLTVATHNVRDFRSAGVQVVDPFA